METRVRSGGSVLPVWGRLDDANWWWEHALDGAAGSLMAGALAGFAIWITVRHERGLAAQTAAQHVAARVQSVAIRIVREIMLADNGDYPALTDDLAELQEAAFEFRAVTRRYWPGAAAAVEKHIPLITAMYLGLASGDVPQMQGVREAAGRPCSARLRACGDPCGHRHAHRGSSHPSYGRRRPCDRRLASQPSHLPR